MVSFRVCLIDCLFFASSHIRRICIFNERRTNLKHRRNPRSCFVRPDSCVVSKFSRAFDAHSRSREFAIETRADEPTDTFNRILFAPVLDTSLVLCDSLPFARKPLIVSTIGFLNFFSSSERLCVFYLLFLSSFHYCNKSSFILFYRRRTATC